MVYNLTAVAMAICILTLPVKDVAKLASGFQIMVIVALNICVLSYGESNLGMQIGIIQTGNHRCIHTCRYLERLPVLFGLQMGVKAIMGAGAALILGLATYKI